MLLKAVEATQHKKAAVEHVHVDEATVAGKADTISDRALVTSLQYKSLAGHKLKLLCR